MTVDVIYGERTATVTFSNSGSLNALDLHTVHDLARTFESIATRADIDVVVLGAEDPGFCAGGDLGFVAEHLNDLSSAVDQFLDQSDALITSLLTMPQVTVSAVDGVAAGAGLSLAAAADISICSDRSTFYPAYARLGVPPDLGGSVTLPHRLGYRRALQLLLLHSSLDARSAHEWGLVDDVQPQEGFSKHLSERISRILDLEQSALRATKSMLVGVHDLESALAHERRHLKVAMSTPSYAHKIRSFVVDAVHGVS